MHYLKILDVLEIFMEFEFQCDSMLKRIKIPNTEL